MYESFFEFRQRPFAVAPQADRYFPARTIEASRQTLERCLARVEGTGLVVGPAGVGKTLLCHKLVERLRTETAVAVPSLGGLSSRRAFLQGILFELGLPYRGLDEGELRLALVERLTGDEHERGILLIVDGAHTLPLRILEEIRMLADLARRGEPRVRLLLVGGPSLEERLAVPRLHSLQQRITARCYLEPLDRGETATYVRHQLLQAGGDPNQIFTEAALDAVYRATDGIPRLINQTCDHALVLACAGGVKPIDVGGIEEAWADLQQLPTPWSRQSLGSVKPLETLNEEVAAPVAKSQAKLEPTLPPGVEKRVLRSVSADDVLELVPLPPLEADRNAVETLDVIETQLAEWESEYTPVAKKEPEVELVLGGGRRDPFVEDFVEEEVVVDRYAAADRLGISPRVQPYGSETAASSSLFGSRRRDAAAPELKVVEESIRENGSRTISHQAIPEPVTRFSSPRDADPVEPDDLVITAARPSSDADMIIVEDDPRFDGAAVPEATLVRNRDYRQMFTRLRRGT